MAVLVCGTYQQDFVALVGNGRSTTTTTRVAANANSGFVILSSGGPQVLYNADPAISTFGISLYLWVSGNPVSGRIPLIIRDNANSRDLFRLRLTSTGASASCVFEIFDGSDWNSAGSLSMTVDNARRKYEFFVVMDPSAGQVIIRKDDSVQLNATGLNTRPTASTAVDQFILDALNTSSGSSTATTVSAIIIADEDTLGMEFYSRNISNGAGALEEWSASIGQTVQSGSDTVIGSDTADQKSTFAKPSLGSGFDAYEVIAVGVSANGRRGGVGPAGIRPMLRRNTAELLGITAELSVAFDEVKSYACFTQDPDGGGVLTRANFDACQPGVQSRAV